jgi:hypothetical protein
MKRSIIFIQLNFTDPEQIEHGIPDNPSKHRVFPVQLLGFIQGKEKLRPVFIWFRRGHA